MEYNEFSQEVCTLYGGKCEDQGRCDRDGCEPSDNDILNGWFDDDPDGFERYKKNQKGISCKTCAHKGDSRYLCVHCDIYELYDPIETKEVRPNGTQ